MAYLLLPPGALQDSVWKTNISAEENWYPGFNFITFPELELDSSISSYHLSLAKCLFYG